MEQSTQEITPYGGGLTILISANPTLMDSWLSFACWSSLQKQLPDATAVLVCCMRERYNHDFFRWAPKVKVPYFVYSGEMDHGRALEVARNRRLVEGAVMVLPSHVMVLDSLEEQHILVLKERPLYVEEEALEAKDSTLSRFCSVLCGVGSFVPDRWIDRNGYPFGNVDRFSKGPLTANERRVFQLWKKIGPLYDTIG